MEPMIIAIICAASFGAVVAIAVFIHQLLLSRDKNLNDEAQRQALAIEAKELEKMREEMQDNKRFDSHHQVLGSNKDAIIYLDTKIEDILQKKMALVNRHAEIALQESEAIVGGEISPKRKATCDRLRQEIDAEIAFYNNELKQMQEKRGSLWDTHGELQDYLVNQEKLRNEHLDALYTKHSAMLEKVYLRHIENSEEIGKKAIEAGASSFKEIVMAPIRFLSQVFNPSSGISSDQADNERAARDEVDAAQDDINEAEGSGDDASEEDNNDSDLESEFRMSTI